MPTSILAATATQNILIATIAALPGVIASLTALAVVVRQLTRVEEQTNGALTGLLRRVDELERALADATNMRSSRPL